MRDFQAVIFDADGVIFDSEKLWDQGDSEFLLKRGLKSFPDGLKAKLAGTSLLEGTALLLKSAESSENVEKAADERIKNMEKLYASHLEFLEGFPDFLNFLKRKMFKTAVATSMSKNLFPLINQRLKVLDLFNGKVYSVSDVEKPKPAPDVYLYAARHINTHPENCIVIEDSPNGIKAAKSAGMFCIGLASTFGPENLNEADRIFKTFDDIKSFINEL